MSDPIISGDTWGAIRTKFNALLALVSGVTADKAAAEAAAAASAASASDADGSATAASGSASSASASASSALTAKTNAEAAATSASGSASTATTKAGEAAASAAAAAASAGTAGTRVAKTSDTGSALVPKGTTAQRDASPVSGYFRFNSDLGKFEGHNGSGWGAVGGGAGGGGTDAVFLENDQTITTSYTIPSGKNAMSTGPVTVNPGVVITVQPGSRWVVI